MGTTGSLDLTKGKGDFRRTRNQRSHGLKKVASLMAILYSIHALVAAVFLQKAGGAGSPSPLKILFSIDFTMPVRKDQGGCRG
jgi:hypothetical protein